MEGVWWVCGEPVMGVWWVCGEPVMGVWWVSGEHVMGECECVMVTDCYSLTLGNHLSELH